MASFTRNWLAPPCASSYQQTLPIPEMKPFDWQSCGFHGNRMNDFMTLKKDTWDPHWQPSPYKLHLKQETSCHDNQNATKETNKMKVEDFTNLNIKSENGAECFYKWTKHEFGNYQNEKIGEQIGKMKFRIGGENFRSPKRYSAAVGKNSGIHNMVAHVESDLASSNYHNMTSLDLSQCVTPCAPQPGLEPRIEALEPLGQCERMVVMEMETAGSFSETPPPTPPYSPSYSSQHSDISSGSIPTFLDEVQDKTYTTLQSAKDRTMTSFDNDMDTSLDQDMNSWSKVHPVNWTSKEVTDFIFWLIAYCTQEEVHIESDALRTASGHDLMRMGPHDFQKLNVKYGQLFYDKFQTLLNEADFKHPPNDLEYDEANYCGDDPCLAASALEEETVPYDPNNAYNILGHDYHFDPQDQFRCCHLGGAPDSHIHEPAYLPAAADGTVSNCYTNMNDGHSQIPMVTPNDYEAPVMSTRPLHQVTPHHQPMKKRGPGRPRKNLPNGQPRPPCQRGRKPGQTTKGNHLYEFILDLLKDPNSNPRLVKWEDSDGGVFRFVQSEEVAKLWGKKKNNPKMTYEKLSRAMRFCRTVNYFAPLPRDRGFPKKLCFKFGTKANWQTPLGVPHVQRLRC